MEQPQGCSSSLKEIEITLFTTRSTSTDRLSVALKQVGGSPAGRLGVSMPKLTTPTQELPHTRVNILPGQVCFSIAQQHQGGVKGEDWEKGTGMLGTLGST